MLELAEKALPLFKETDRKLGMISQMPVKSLHVALECHSCYRWLLPALNELRKAWPETDVDLSAEFNFFPLPKLLSKELDMVITGDPDFKPGIEYVPLFDFEIRLGVSSKNPLARKQSALPEDLAGETIVAYPVEKERLSIFSKFLTPAGISPARLRKVELTIMIIDLVANDKGVCCLPTWVFDEYAKTEGLKVLRMGKRGVRETLYLACRFEDAEKDFVGDFVGLAKKICSRELANIVIR